MLLQKILKSSLIMIMSLNLMLIDFQIKTQSFGFNLANAQSEGDVLYTANDEAEAAIEKEQIKEVEKNEKLQEQKRAAALKTSKKVESELKDASRFAREKEKELKDALSVSKSLEDELKGASNLAEKKKNELEDAFRNYNQNGKDALSSEIVKQKEIELAAARENLKQKEIQLSDALKNSIKKENELAIARENLKQKEIQFSDIQKQNEQNSSSTGIAGVSEAEQAEANQATKSVTETVEGKDLKSESWAATLAMVAIGLVTSRLVSCKMTADMGLAAAGGVAFIAGEITAFLKLKKALKGFKVEIDYLAGKEKFDAQRQALLKIREGYVKALEAAEMKKKLQIASAVAFMAAATAAGIGGANESAGLVSCNTASTTAIGECKAAQAPLCKSHGNCFFPFVSGALMGGAAQTKIAIGHVARRIPGLSSAMQARLTAEDSANVGSLSTAASQCPVFSQALAACSTFLGIRQMNTGACAIPLTGAVNNKMQFRTIEDLKKTNPSYWNRFLNIIIPEAKAIDLGVIGIAASLAINYVLATSTTIAGYIDGFLHESFNRMKVWIALAGLAYMTSNKTQEVITQLEGYIAKIDGVLAGYEEQKLGKDIASGHKPQQPVSNFSENKKNEVIKLPGGKKSEVSSISTNTESTNSTSSNNSNNSNNSDYHIGEKTPCLAGEKAGKCNSFSDMITSSGSFSKLDPKMQQQFQNIAKTMDKLSGTDTITSGTLADLNSIAKNSATNLNTLKEDLIKKYKIPKDELKDLDKNKNELLDVVNKELKKQNTTAQKMYASFSDVNPAGFNSSKGEKSNNSGKAELASLGNMEQLGLGQNNALNGLFSGSNQLKNKEEIDHAAAQSEVKVEEDEKKVDADEIHEIAGQFGDDELIDLSKMGGNLDINKDDKTSLFQVISNRYQKSGYGRLFPNKKAYEIEAQR